MFVRKERKVLLRKWKQTLKELEQLWICWYLWLETYCSTLNMIMKNFHPVIMLLWYAVCSCKSDNIKMCYIINSVPVTVL
jgi:hypothetical protein